MKAVLKKKRRAHVRPSRTPATPSCAWQNRTTRNVPHDHLWKELKCCIKPRLRRLKYRDRTLFGKVVCMPYKSRARRMTWRLVRTSVCYSTTPMAQYKLLYAYRTSASPSNPSSKECQGRKPKLLRHQSLNVDSTRSRDNEHTRDHEHTPCISADSVRTSLMYSSIHGRLAYSLILAADMPCRNRNSGRLLYRPPSKGCISETTANTTAAITVHTNMGHPHHTSVQSRPDDLFRDRSLAEMPCVGGHVAAYASRADRCATWVREECMVLISTLM